MKKQNFKLLTGTITEYVVAKQLTFQVIGGITDPNDDNDDPPKDTGDLGTTDDPRNDQASQGANTDSRG